LTEEIDKSPWWISRVERELGKISKEEKIKIAKALETEVKRIFP